MTETFERGINPQKLRRLTDLSEEPRENWWKHLLAKWRPSGTDSGEDGVRLAIRNQTLNFYRLGQSVGRISVSRETPQSELHAKYVLDKAEVAQRFSGYKRPMAKVRNGLVMFPDKSTMEYVGGDMLRGWIIRAGTEYADEEKTSVDKIITQTHSVIDVEACWSGGRAPRIDLVFLESQAHKRHRIVFVEVKRATDDRMPQSEGSGDRDKTLAQLGVYRRFLSLQANQEQIKRAYSNASKDMRALLAMTGLKGNAHVLSPEDLDVDPIPRLAIEWPIRFSPRRLSPEKLSEKFNAYPIAILDENRGYSLETAQWLRR